MAEIGARQREVVCDNHHARGVAKHSSTSVVHVARLTVSRIDPKSSLVNENGMAKSVSAQGKP
jgi:hypothetical protein